MLVLFGANGPGREPPGPNLPECSKGYSPLFVFSSMQRTYPEINVQDRLPLAPVRNPWQEVRWWGFLIGDAYVNPFHDLLHALSRDARPSVARGRGKLRTVTFGEEQFIIRDAKGREEPYRYAELFNLKLFYHELHHQQPLAGRLSFGFFLTLEWDDSAKVRSIHLRIGYGQYRSLLDFLYRHHVVFREYLSGLRSYRAETNIPYGKVQEIKREHGVPW